MFNKLWILIRAWWTNSLVERWDMLLYTLSIIIAPTILLFIWFAVSNQSNSLTMDRNQLAIYFLLVMLVKAMGASWMGGFLPGRIRRGEISPYLLKPMPYLLDPIANNIAEKLFRLFFLFPFMIFLYISLGIQAPDMTFFQLLLTFISILFAGAIYFLLDICIGLLAFWWEETRALQELIGLLESFFSGRHVPLLLLPLFWKSISNVLPFRYTMSFPIEIFLSQLENSQLFLGLLAQMSYLVLFILLYKFLWTHGIKKYSASGA